jgi:hypothetical protein
MKKGLPQPEGREERIFLYIISTVFIIILNRSGSVIIMITINSLKQNPFEMLHAENLYPVINTYAWNLECMILIKACQHILNI